VRILLVVVTLAIALNASAAYSTTLLPPASSTTRWSVAGDRKTILFSVDGSIPKPFIIKGVDYSPRPINDAAMTFPGTDYFWGDPAHLTYGPIWQRDLWGATYDDTRVNLPDGLVRQLGANSIRTYAWWKWVPMVPADYAKWNTLDWSVTPRVRYGASAAPAGFAAWPAHDGGDQFLDLCWNHGVHPIYVVIGISIDPWYSFPGANSDSTLMRNERMFIERTTQWLAQRYGYHPAVLGFAIGNETNLPLAQGTDKYIDYWQYLNRLGAIVKHYAPGKLTMSAFADYPTSETPMLVKPLVAFKDAADAHIGGQTVPLCVDPNGADVGVDCTSAHRRRAYPADIYALDIWGFNAYRSPETEEAAQFKRWIVDGYYTSGAEKDSEAPNPAPKPMIFTEWGAPASIRTREGQPPAPPNPQWVSASPSVRGEFHGAAGYRAARLIEQIATDMYGPHSTLSTAGGGIMSGGYLFEFQDEWWKEAQRRPATWSSHDTTILTSTFPFGEPGRGGFSSYWDEEWFGLMSVAPNPGRRAADPVLKISDGERSLNGGADILTPRAGYYALQGVFNGTNPSPPLIVSHLTAISFPPHANSH
jgi:hypothetical protein